MIRQIKRVRGGYFVEDFGKVPSVTSLLSMLDKPALKYWFGKVVGQHIINAVREMVEEHGDNYTARELYSQLNLDAVYERAKKQPTLVSEDALDKGRRLHACVEAFFKGEDFIVMPDIELPWEAFLSQVKEFNLKPIVTEQVVWMPKRGGFAGTLDQVSELLIPGARVPKLYVIDFKTSGGFYSEYDLQISAYYHAWNDMHPEAKAEGGAILRLDKETGIPEWRFFARKDLKKNFQGFVCLVEYYHKMKRK